MGVSARIFLPLWVSDDVLRTTVGHLCGWRMPLQVSPHELFWTGLEPSPYATEKAVWAHITTPFDDYDHLAFSLPEGPQFYWMRFEVLEEGPTLQMNPGSYAFSVALGKKLVETFGGKLLPSDSVDETLPEHWYCVPTSKARWRPPVGRTQFQEQALPLLLEALTPEWLLTAEDVEAAKAYVSFTDKCVEACTALRQNAARQAEYRALNKELPLCQPGGTRKQRL